MREVIAEIHDAENPRNHRLTDREIVRCRDCAYFTRKGNVGVCAYAKWTIGTNGFCYYGIRKVAEAEEEEDIG